ncbi:MAG: YfcE family phosphodiesterase [Velocimicrobium sp.]
MKILIVSDSHGRNIYLKRVLENVGCIDLLIHLGDLEGSENFLKENVDCPIEMVSGNNDYFTSIDREKEIYIGPYKVLLTHGHRHNVNCGTECIKEWARTNQATIVMCGHTHIPIIDQNSDVIVINPGSISQPRQEGHRPSYILMEVEETGEIHFALNYLN